MYQRAKFVAVVVPLCLGITLGFSRSQQQRRNNLTGVWALEMHTSGDSSDTVTHHGIVVLVNYAGDSAPWSFNILGPDYVGAFTLAAPVPAYLLPAVRQFPSVAARRLAGDSVEMALGSQRSDHGWLSLSGSMKGDSSCGVWALAAYSVTHLGSYCLRRKTD